MDFRRLHACLRDDFSLLRAAVGSSAPEAAVPSCPEWTVTDLAHHVAEVYLHKAECIRLGAFPQPWPPEQLNPDPVAALDESFAALEGQFAAHAPEDHAATWHEPDQTVGFWIRRMAQETVIHRIDAELAAGTAVSPVAEDLALDGIDEVLQLFFAYGSVQWHDEVADLLAKADERPILVSTSAGPSWLVSAHPSGIVAAGAETDTGTSATEDAAAALTVSGDADAVLLWLWNRTEAGPSAAIAGDPLSLAQFHALKVALTQ